MNISRRNLLLLFAGTFAANAVHTKKAFADGAGVSGFEHLEALSLMDPLTSSFTTASRSGGTWRARSAGTGANMSLVATTMRYT